MSLFHATVSYMRLFERRDGRYYFIDAPEIDLLGDHIVTTRRGSRYSRLGGCKTYVGADPTEINRVIMRIVRRRLRHGYFEVIEQAS